MMRTVLLSCPIKAEIRVVDNHIRFENFVIGMINVEINAVHSQSD